MVPSASIPAARQNRSKLADTSAQAIPTGPKTEGGKAVALVLSLFMALLSFRGISTPSLPAQGEQRRFSFFNIRRDIPRVWHVSPLAPGTVSSTTPVDTIETAPSSTTDEIILEELAADEVAPTDAQPSETPSVEAPPAGLTEVHIIGAKYTDYFTDGTNTYAFPGDPDIDGNLDKPNAPIPTHEGLTWVNTTGQRLYNTPSGDLEVGQYAAQHDGSFAVYVATSTYSDATSTVLIPAHIYVTSTGTSKTAATEPEAQASADAATTVPESEATATTTSSDDVSNSSASSSSNAEPSSAVPEDTPPSDQTSSASTSTP